MGSQSDPNQEATMTSFDQQMVGENDSPAPANLNGETLHFMEAEPAGRGMCFHYLLKTDAS
jgi:hypothetical protein